MSITNIRIALETALAGMSPALVTVYENTSLTPVTGTPYQMAHLLPADPDDSERDAPPRESGIFQVSLMYPINNGTADANARIELVRATFYKKATFTAGGERVIIDKTPSVSAGYFDDDRWRVPIRISWFTN